MNSYLFNKLLFNFIFLAAQKLLTWVTFIVPFTLNGNAEKSTTSIDSIKIEQKSHIMFGYFLSEFLKLCKF